MKKLIVLAIVMVYVLSLVGCDAEGNEVMEDFVGIVTGINDDNTSYLVKVTDSGSSNLKMGDRVIVQMGDGGDAEYSVDDYIKVNFNGIVEELTEISMAEKCITRVFAIEKIDSAKTDAE